ncbi:glycosyltransferase [Curtobacterium sp. 'Ferrero']|uniref:glycosyltransferase n=1 Tax=Curtobacterium sp. 'Ferrero' TaxID=2033654 RepID=UPI001596440C|nr:glycosyltransferase [Curtobacterium sp. 'Ferrero']
MPSVVRHLRRVGRAARAEVGAFWRSRPVDADLVLYESFAGNGAAGNPEAIWRELLAADDQQHLRHVWALDAAALRTVGPVLRRARGTTVVLRGSNAYQRALATAGTLVNNATFPPSFSRRPEQRYLNTWHGTPLKRMGFDEPDGATASANTVRNLLAATHLLSQSPWMTETMYRRAYRLGGLATAEVLEVGYPRVDRQTGVDDARLRRHLRDSGVRIGTEPIVLYAPTWRGDRFADPEDRSAPMADLVDDVEAALRRRGIAATVLVKPHQVVARAARREPRLDGRLVPEDVPVNVLLGGAAVLVSDYSSIIVDWLATGKPVVLEADPDHGYEDTRGLYLSDGWPGPRCTTAAETAEAVAQALDGGIPTAHRDAYAAMRARLVPDDDGHAARRVVDVLFRDGVPDRGRVRTLTGDGRPSVLLHLGALRSNGITTAAVNLLPLLVDAGLDVTVTYDQAVRGAGVVNRARIDPRVRQLQRVGGMNGSKALHLGRRVAEHRAQARAHTDSPRLRGLWDEEWRRCFGGAHFDAVVDFSGYSPFWAELLLHAPGPVRRSIWLHNEMAAEVDREVDGKPRMRRSLRFVFGLYPQYDRAVSVSETLAVHNARSLAEYGSATHVAVPNAVAADRVRAAATAPVPPSPWRASLVDRVDGTTWFVAVGRLSPEKNHARLLRAFAVVHGEAPRTRLLVVGGGFLLPTLRALAVDLGIADVVVFTDAVDDAAPLVAAADCLVVSSDHEGQPMVILEAAALGKPVVTTAFASVADALPGGGAHVVPVTDAGLVSGMRAFLDGRVAAPTVDVVAYDADVVQTFIRTVLPGRTEGRRPALPGTGGQEAA